jgi:hypothetical protein
MTPTTIKEKIEHALAHEDIESLITVLVALKSPGSHWEREITERLERFRQDANLTQFVDIGDATESQLAKLANFVSESVSSQSQALGSGAPSQSLSF